MKTWEKEVLHGTFKTKREIENKRLEEEERLKAERRRKMAMDVKDTVVQKVSNPKQTYAEGKQAVESDAEGQAGCRC